RHGRDHVGVDVAGRDAIHSDALARAFLRERLGEADHAGFRRRVVHLPGLALLPIDRADIDDAAPTARAHAFDDLPRHVETRIHVDADDIVPLFVAHFVEEAVAGDARIVDEHVDRPELRRDRRGPADAVVPYADIAFHYHDAEFIRGGARGGLVAGIASRDLHAIGFEARRDRLADAAGAACNERNASHGYASLRFLCVGITLRELGPE